jgi:hypothetical protein
MNTSPLSSVNICLIRHTHCSPE